MQRYRCMHCNRTYLLEPKSAGNTGSVPKQTFAIVSNSVNGLKPALVPAGAEVPAPADVTFSAREKKSVLSRLVDWGGTSNSWGWLPEIAVLQAAGLLFLAWAFVEARASAASSELLFWMGLTILILPTAFRLASAEPTRRERIGLVLLLGMSLYLVKVMHSPMAFTFPDELSHLRNINEILRTHRLFQENPVQPVTALYPGLPTITSTLISLSGLSTFYAGILVIGAARLILFLALFLLYEQVSGSSRVAGLGVLLYMANANFLYWTAEYAYEPLALPLITFVLLAVAKRESVTDRRQYLAWTVAGLAGILTVVITHHMSSYILTALLIALVIFYRIRSHGKEWGPWDLALVALVATSAWLILVANLTINYLSPVVVGAIRSVFNLVVEEEQSRELFTSAGGVAPLWEQIVGIGSVILIALGLPFGVFEILEKHRDNMIALLLAVIGIAYLPMQMLRFSNAGWETANRSSEFLFIGIGFVLALGIVRFWSLSWPGWKTQTLLAVLTVTIFFGGLIVGWPPRARLPRAYVVSTGDHLVKPQVVSVAEWMLANLGPDNRVAASKADAKVIGAYNQYPFTSSAGGIRNLFFSEGVGRSERKSLSKRNIEYVMSDRKVVSWDHMIGYYFYNQQHGTSSELNLMDQSTFEKFDGLEGVDRILDAGDIVLYNVGRYLEMNNGGSRTASINSSTTTLQVTFPKLEAPRIPPENFKENSVAIGGRIPQLMLSSGNGRSPDTNQVRTQAPAQSSSCGARSTGTIMKLEMNWRLFLDKGSQPGCMDGRRP